MMLSYSIIHSVHKLRYTLAEIRKIFFFILLSSCYLGVATELEDPSPEHEQAIRHHQLTLEPGETKNIPLASESQIRVSRKGFVDVQIYKNHIRIFALKAGLVVITFTKPNQVEDDIKYFVTIKSKEADAPIETSLQEFKDLCAAHRLACDKKQYTIHGIFDSYELFYKIKLRCEQIKSCHFLGSLSINSQKELSSHLQTLFDAKFEILVKANGSLVGFIPCSEAHSEKNYKALAEHLLGKSSFKENFLIACKKDWYAGSFKLSSKIVVIERTAAQELGLKSIIRGQGSLAKMDINGDLDLSLQAALKEKKAHIVGEPTLWLNSGSEGRAQSGAEFLTIKEQAESSREHVYAWKDSGMDLKVKIFPLDEKKVRLQYTFVISNPSAKDSGHLHRSKLESEVEVPLDKSVIVGEIQFQSSGDQKGSLPILDKIPILGPLLKTSSQNEVETNLYLYFLIQRIAPS